MCGTALVRSLNWLVHKLLAASLRDKPSLFLYSQKRSVALNSRDDWRRSLRSHVLRSLRSHSGVSDSDVLRIGFLFFVTDISGYASLL